MGIAGEGLGDLQHAARDLARFILAFQDIDLAGQSMSGVPRSNRGGPLLERDAETRAAIAALGDMVDGNAAIAAWEAAVATPVWDRAPLWIHGDLIPTNLLAANGRLSAVIDFGCAGRGDPACDLQPAWNLLEGEARATFRAALNVDDATWRRGSGWALSVGVIALPYYRETNAVLAAISRRAIEAVCSTYGRA